MLGFINHDTPLHKLPELAKSIGISIAIGNTALKLLGIRSIPKFAVLHSTSTEAVTVVFPETVDVAEGKKRT